MVISNQIRSKKNKINFLDEYLHLREIKIFFDKNMFIFSLLGPLVTTPQVIRIWSRQSAQDISMITWTGYLIIALIWLKYGLVHKDKKIVLSSVLWMVMYLLIIAGKALYG